jgi:hypothetical protein
MDDGLKAAGLCVVGAAGAVLLGYAAHELMRYANGQAIIAGAPLPALTVFALACLMGFALNQLTAKSK